jgi:hypothetical protein
MKFFMNFVIFFSAFYVPQPLVAEEKEESRIRISIERPESVLLEDRRGGVDSSNPWKSIERTHVSDGCRRELHHLSKFLPTRSHLRVFNRKTRIRTSQHQGSEGRLEDESEMLRSESK